MNNQQRGPPTTLQGSMLTKTMSITMGWTETCDVQYILPIYKMGQRVEARGHACILNAHGLVFSTYIL